VIYAAWSRSSDMEPPSSTRRAYENQPDASEWHNEWPDHARFDLGSGNMR
jgi:hypothetical protein